MWNVFDGAGYKIASMSTKSAAQDFALMFAEQERAAGRLYLSCAYVREAT